MTGYWCPKCGAWCKHSEQCECRKRERKRTRPPKRKRYASGNYAKSPHYDTRWDRLSRRYRKEHPLCERCLALGRTTPATECHHKLKVHIRPDLIHDERNIEALCKACHRIRDRE